MKSRGSESLGPNKTQWQGRMCGAVSILEGVMFGEPGKQLEDSLKMGRKIGQALSKWLSFPLKMVVISHKTFL